MRKSLLLVVLSALSVLAVVAGVLLWRNSRPPGQAVAKAEGGIIPKMAAPEFTAPGADGHDVSLSSLRGDYVILFFSGGLGCFTCLPQIEQLNKERLLNGSDVVAFSVVPDSSLAWQQASGASSSLAQAKPLFDTNGKVFEEYRDLNISSLMRQGLHMAHTYFIINKTGTIVSVFDDPSMGTRNDELISLLEKIKEIESTETEKRGGANLPRP